MERKGKGRCQCRRARHPTYDSPPTEVRPPPQHQRLPLTAPTPTWDLSGQAIGVGVGVGSRGVSP